MKINLNLKRRLKNFQLKEAEKLKYLYLIALKQFKNMQGYELFEKIYKQTYKKYKGKIPLKAEVEVSGLGLVDIDGYLTNEDPTEPEFNLNLILTKKKGFLKKTEVKKQYKINGNVRNFNVKPEPSTKYKVGFLTAILTAINDCVFKPVGESAKMIYLKKQNDKLEGGEDGKSNGN